MPVQSWLTGMLATCTPRISLRGNEKLSEKGGFFYCFVVTKSEIGTLRKFWVRGDRALLPRGDVARATKR